MAPTPPDRPVVTKTKFTATDAARIALARPPRPLTPARRRVLAAAATLWCRGLQFPTVREIGAALGLRSPSTVVGGFDGLIDVHAAVIRTEWQRIDQGWMTSSSGDRSRWLVEHGRELAAIDPSCLRLPSLVCSAVLGSGAVPLRPGAHLVVPLHALAAFADAPATALDPVVVRRLVRAVPDLPGQDVGLAVPA
jgi:hypothetical protein